MDDLESPFYLVHGRNPIEGRLSNLQNYCRYPNDQSGQIAVQEPRKLWKLHAKLLTENRFTKHKNNRKVTKASDLKIGQLVFVKDHCKGPFDPSYTFDHRVAAIVKESTVVLTTPDGKEKRCNIHHIKPMYMAESTEGAFQQFWDTIQKIQLACSKVTSIIHVQKTTCCSMASNAKVGNFNNFTMWHIWNSGEFQVFPVVSVN